VREAITIFWRLSVATELILAVRLLLQGLGSVYPALTISSVGFALQALMLMMSPDPAHPSRLLMKVAWRLSEPIVWLLWFWIVLELFGRWTQSYPGIGRFGRLLLGALSVIALSVSLISWPVEWKALVFAHDFRIYYFLTRVLMGTLALFTLSVWLFFRNYPAPVAPNIVRHTHVTAFYLAATALSWLLHNFHQVALANLSIVVLAVGCFPAWAILLTRKGEEVALVPAMPPEDIARIEHVNRQLLVLMRRLPGEVAGGA